MTLFAILLVGILKFKRVILLFLFCLREFAHTRYEKTTWSNMNINETGMESEFGELYSSILICNQGKVVAPPVPSSFEHYTLSSHPLDSSHLATLSASALHFVTSTLAISSPPISLHIQILLPSEQGHHQRYCKLPWK